VPLPELPELPELVPEGAGVAVGVTVVVCDGVEVVGTGA
jgi:hypothetical protein